MTPPFTVLSSLDEIARNVESASLESAPGLPDRAFEVERVGENIRWHQDSRSLSFPRESITALETLSLEHAGEQFVALALTFTSGEESLRYRLISSHESEAEWLAKVSAQIAQLLGISISRDTDDDAAPDPDAR